MFRTFAGASVSAGGGVPSGQPAAKAGWHPTVVYLGVLLVVEFVAVAFLTRHLLKED
ncbi:MAG: hypothetical protein M0010_15315 [Actinomycetota bacterium]|jgi:hypothetical protein|nr:hypothetical protein [Actinomycetota bacterium]